MRSYDFKITLGEDIAECELHTPTQGNRLLENPIQRESNLATITVLEQWLKRWEWIALYRDTKGEDLLVPDTFKVLGDHLWNLAFRPNIGNELMKAHKTNEELDEDSKLPIRVRISFTSGAKDLATLPWEFLRCPEEPDFYLAAQSNIVLARWLTDEKDRSIRTADRTVRIVFVLILPDSGDIFTKERSEFTNLLIGLNKLRPDLDVVMIDGWKPSELATELRRLKDEGKVVDVVHIVGVCQETRAEPRIYLPDDTRDKWDYRDPQPIVTALTADAATRPPALAVLHLSDRSVKSRRGFEPPAHFERLAPAFVKAGIPCVLAMQYPMTEPHGSDFVIELYTQLVSGATIGHAVQKARSDEYIGRQLNRHFGAPVLYMQTAQDGLLLSKSPVIEQSYDPTSTRKSTHAQTKPLRASVNGPTDLGRILLDEVELNSPDVTTANAVQQEIAQIVNWPDDLSKAWLVLQGMRRANLDNPSKQRVYAQLMAKVNTMLSEQSGEAGA
jgi:hypothetical protein